MSQESSREAGRCDSSYSAATGSTANSSQWSRTSSQRSRHGHEDAIHQGIFDLSHLVATYVASALSFFVGLCLMLASPMVKIVRIIVGDVMGLWRDAAPLRRRGRAGVPPSPGSPERRRDSARYYGHDDDNTARTDIATEASPLFVGGWRPGGDATPRAGPATTGEPPSLRGPPSPCDRSHAHLPRTYAAPRGREARLSSHPSYVSYDDGCGARPYRHGPPPARAALGHRPDGDRRHAPPRPATLPLPPPPPHRRRRSNPTSATAARPFRKTGDVASV